MSRPDEMADRLEERRMDGWRELKTLQEVAAAQAACEEIEFKSWRMSSTWEPWVEVDWFKNASYRSRPRKKTKTIVMREALFDNPIGGFYIAWCEDCAKDSGTFVFWLDTPPREIEVEQ